MTPRSIRRAAERKAAKVARKAQIDSLEPVVEPTTITVPAAVAAPATIAAPNAGLPWRPHSLSSISSHPVIEEGPRLAANRANAQLSTGPRSFEGKVRVSLNAVKTALTGRTVLLPGDDAAAYQAHITAHEAHFAPQGLEESNLVQSLAEIRWRLNRIPGLEMAVYARGRIQFASAFDDRDPAERPVLIEVETYLTYEKPIRNLQLQEARLARRYENEMKELRRLQDDRKRLAAAQTAKTAGQQAKPVTNPPVGFEFSTAPFTHSEPTSAAIPDPIAITALASISH